MKIASMMFINSDHPDQSYRPERPAELALSEVERAVERRYLSGAAPGPERRAGKISPLASLGRNDGLGRAATAAPGGMTVTGRLGRDDGVGAVARNDGRAGGGTAVLVPVLGRHDETVPRMGRRREKIPLPPPGPGRCGSLGLLRRPAGGSRRKPQMPLVRRSPENQICRHGSPLLGPDFEFARFRFDDWNTGRRRRCRRRQQTIRRAVLT